MAAGTANRVGLRKAAELAGNGLPHAQNVCGDTWRVPHSPAASPWPRWPAPAYRDGILRAFTAGAHEAAPLRSSLSPAFLFGRP